MRSQTITLLAFTDSGWTRRRHLPKLAAILLVGLTLAAPLFTAFAIRAGAELRRLRAVERENRWLTTQLQNQATLLERLHGEMSRLHELETHLRAAAGLAHRPATNEGTGHGQHLGLGKEVPQCSRSSC